MLSKHNSIQRDQLEKITLYQLVPANHLVRKIEAAIDFSFIYDLVKDMYSE
ncbi:IS5/IS1182 family transposase, partial [Peribacillus sp. NPDC046944]